MMTKGNEMTQGRSDLGSTDLDDLLATAATRRMAPSDALMAQLDAAGIPYVRHDHVPLRTVADAKEVQDAMGAGRVP